MMSLSQENNYLFPELVLHEICDFLNLSELKAFRLVCVQWYCVAETHIQIRGQLVFDNRFRKNEKFKDFAMSNQSGGYSPVRNLKMFVCPRSVGCKCPKCHGVAENNFHKEFEKSSRQFDDTLETIVAKCTSGIKSFGLYVEKRDVDENHLEINYEKLLLLEQFKILKELYIYYPFKLTKDSGINSVFQRLTSLYLGYICGNESFSANVFSECCHLKSLTVGPSYEFFDLDFRTGIIRILDGLSNAMKINDYLQIEKMIIIKPRFRLAVPDTIIFSKLRELNLKLKVLDISFTIDCRKPNEYLALMSEIQVLLESQKNSLVKLVLPEVWSSSQSELKYFPRMKNLKEFKSNVNFQLPVMDLQSKFPILKAITVEFYHILEILVIGDDYNCPLEFANQLKQNIPPCTTVTEMTLSYLRYGAMLADFNKMFPNVQSLTIDLKCEDLQKLWGCWPKLKTLNLTVIDNHSRNNRFYRSQDFHLLTELELSVKFHSALIGIPENHCEALLESSVSFLTLNVDNYDYGRPSIRDFSELTKLHLNCDLACNAALMLGVLPIKSLMEVYVGDGQMTIDCVQHLLNSRPNINRWEFVGTCILEMHYRDFANPFPKEWINWTVSSSNNDKYQPIYAMKNCRTWKGYASHPLPDAMYQTILRSINKYGRGRCLIWTHYHVPNSPDEDK